ncbi:MAG: hypothetical protein V3S85_02615 [Nitrospirales bacterium]
MSRLNILVAVALVLVIFLATGETANRIPSLEDLLKFERQLLRKRRETPNLGPFGSDPFKIRYYPQSEQYLILLRNRSEVLLTDRTLNLVDRQVTPQSPSGWTLVQNRFLFISGELSPEIQLFEVTVKGLLPRTKFRVQGVASIRDLVYVPSSRSLFLLDEFDRRLIQVTLPSDWLSQKHFKIEQKTYPLGAGPIQIRAHDNHLLINLVLEHTLMIVPLAQGRPDFSRASRINHDGPIWAFDAIARHDSLVIAAAGVENRPLNRLGGEFGYIDSFLYLYTLPRTEGVYRWNPMDRNKSRRFTQANLSEIDVITPKAVKFAAPSKDSLTVWVSAFGSAKMARFKFDQSKILLTGTFDVIPGSTDFVIVPKNQSSGTRNKNDQSMIMTNSLLDGIYRVNLRVDGSEYQRVKELPSDLSRLSWQNRIGELLFFTNLLTPSNRSEGELSRFTCEACHFEGTIDGRVHYTGRGHVFATTKPLRGVANNVPLFSRAGDKSLASMVLAEFRVANQKRQDFFFVDTSKYPWLEGIENLPKVLSPRDLRMAFLSFFVEYRPRPNPWRLRSEKLSPKALQGLAVFRERCEYCHQAIVSTRQGDSLPYADWVKWLEAKGKDLVWGAPFYTKTGIKPYVHRAGARVPSLRRVQQKYPYFTNGSSPTLRHLLSRFRYRDLTAWHHYEESAEGGGAEKVKALTADEIKSLEEILRFF